jgi:hypothetical protein
MRFLQNNLNDEAKLALAIEAVSKIAGQSTDGSNSLYRDRALERRQALNQPDHPAPMPKKQKLKHTELLPKPPAADPEKPIEESNIGSKLLAGMGWSAGAGLGSSAGGRVDPIQAKAFAQGAGIGASRGKSLLIAASRPANVRPTEQAYLQASKLRSHGKAASLAGVKQELACSMMRPRSTSRYYLSTASAGRSTVLQAITVRFSSFEHIVTVQQALYE